jgi:two-component system, chemotaxis family, protein-glutamate methylesterase/glutaminase
MPVGWVCAYSAGMARDIVVIGGSAGSLDVLNTIARGLPPDLPATLFVVMHTAPQAESLLPELLSRRGALPAVHAVDGEPIAPGRIYVAPPDHHLLVYPHHVRVTRGPKENRHRPAVDPLFRSAARAYGKRVIGVVVSGSLDDGTAGLGAVKQAGGLALVQDPDEAVARGMPTNALKHVTVDRIVRAHEVAPVIVAEALAPAMPEPPTIPVAPDQEGPDAGEPSGERAVYSCPECGGVLMETREGGVHRFRCNVGHALSEESLLDGQQSTLEYALWEALRVLGERAALLRRLGSRTRGSAPTAAHFDAQAADAERRAGLVRQALVDLTGPGAKRAQG